MMLRLAFNRLLVADFRAVFLFYRDVLGFTPTFGDENDVYADFDTGSVTVALFQRELMTEAMGTSDKPSAAESQDRVAFIYSVEEVDTTYNDLRARGVAFIAEPQDRTEWGIRVAHFRDPDGNLLEIFSPLPRSS